MGSFLLWTLAPAALGAFVWCLREILPRLRWLDAKLLLVCALAVAAQAPQIGRAHV